MISVRLPPTFIVATPSSQPAMTCRAEHELKRLAAIARAVELLAVGERARVVHGHLLSGARFCTGSDLEIFDHELSLSHARFLQERVAWRIRARHTTECEHGLRYSNVAHALHR